MSRHQNPRHNKRRLTIAAIAATALLGTAVTVGILGTAYGEENQAASEQSEQCVSLDQNGDQESNLQQDGDLGDNEQGDVQEGDDQQGDVQEGDDQQGDYNGVTAPQAVRPAGGGDQGDRGDRGGDRGGRGGDRGDRGDQGDRGDRGGDRGGRGGDRGDRGDQGDEPQQCVGPFVEDFVDINDVEPVQLGVEPGETGSTGTFVSKCGNNENLHQNTDNIVIAPGTPNGAEHLHDYVGNFDTTFASTEESLAASGTTCTNNDQSTYFWPILRNRSPDDGFDVVSVKDENNIGEPVLPADVKVEFRGNPTSDVTAMPRFLRLFSGDAKTITNGLGNARPTYTCTGFEDRITDKYPLCPEGSDLLSIHDYPGCWDGENLDSENHRDHLAFADVETGACPEGTVAIPQLRVTLTYGDDLNSISQGFAVDGFSTEEHDPASDHAGAINVMEEDLMQEAVDCINSGQQC